MSGNESGKDLIFRRSLERETRLRLMAGKETFSLSVKLQETNGINSLILILPNSVDMQIGKDGTLLFWLEPKPKNTSSWMQIGLTVLRRLLNRL